MIAAIVDDHKSEACSRARDSQVIVVASNGASPHLWPRCKMTFLGGVAVAFVVVLVESEQI
jgi:hypothetical protein